MLIETTYQTKVATAIQTAIQNDANYAQDSDKLNWDLFDIETFMLVRTKDTKENIQEYYTILTAFKEEYEKQDAA